MTLTLQLSVWLALCIPGWIAQMVLSYRTFGRLQVFRALKSEEALVDGTRHVLVFEALGLAAWSVYLAIGLAALFDTNTTPAVGRTLIGQLIVWGLLTGLGLLTCQTIYSFMIGQREERRAT